MFSWSGGWFCLITPLFRYNLLLSLTFLVLPKPQLDTHNCASLCLGGRYLLNFGDRNTNQAVMSMSAATVWLWLQSLTGIVVKLDSLDLACFVANEAAYRQLRLLHAWHFTHSFTSYQTLHTHLTPVEIPYALTWHQLIYTMHSTNTSWNTIRTHLTAWPLYPASNSGNCSLLDSLAITCMHVCLAIRVVFFLY